MLIMNIRIAEDTPCRLTFLYIVATVALYGLQPSSVVVQPSSQSLTNCPLHLSLHLPHIHPHTIDNSQPTSQYTQAQPLACVTLLR